MDSVNQRLTNVIDFLKNSREIYNDADFAKRIGKSRSYVSEAKSGSRTITEQFVLLIESEFPVVNGAYILSGEGSMLKDNAPTDEDYLPRITDNPNEGRPYYDVDFLGGYGELDSDTGAVASYNIDYKPFNRDGVFYGNLYGDSMFPEFHSGAVLAMRCVENWRDYLLLDKVYAIVTTGGQRTVKRLTKGEDKDSYTLVPINPKYEAQTIPKRAILAVYEVLGGINRYE